MTPQCGIYPGVENGDVRRSLIWEMNLVIVVLHHGGGVQLPNLSSVSLYGSNMCPVSVSCPADDVDCEQE